MLDTLERPPLFDALAERRIIGACLMSADALEIARVEVAPEDFYLSAHAALLRLMSRMADNCHPIDVATVASAMRRANALDRVGGSSYLMDLADGRDGADATGYYCRRVREMAIRRNLVAAAERTVQRAYNLDAETSTVQDESEADILEISNFANVAIPTWQEVADEAWRSLHQDSRGVTPFLACLRHGDIGFPDREFSLIGATRGTGKTSFALDQTRYLCRAGVGVLAFSLEMSGDDLYQRLVAMEIGCAIKSMRRGVKASDAWMAGRVEDAWNRVKAWPLIVDDRGSLSVSEIAAAVRRTRRQMDRNGVPLALVWIDYAQLVTAPGCEPGYKSMSAVADQLRVACKGYRVATMLLSQVSQESTNRKDGFPVVHAKNSRELEDAAGLVAWMHRPGINGQPANIADRDNPNGVKILVSKARDGGEERLYKAGWRLGPGGFVDVIDEEPESEPDYGDPFDTE